MKVLIAVDGSPCSDAVIADVAGRPWPDGSTLKVIMVDPPLEASLLKGSPTVLDDLTQNKRLEAHRRVRDAAEMLRANIANVTVVPQVIEGWPKEAILDEAENWGANLIVVGSHGYGTFRRFFLGSISLTVAMNATCSVMIVRPPPGK